MQPQNITRSPVLVAFACVLALALAFPALASADGPSSDGGAANYSSERDSASYSQSIVGDRPSERESAGTATTAAVAPTSDDGANVALIIGLSLAGLAAGGAAWVVVRRRHHGGLTPTGSA